MESYDYVIVGAGTAGCVLAARLTEDAGVGVLLLEAGGWDRDPRLRIPLAWGRILQQRLHDWMYFAEPSATMNRRRIECARGKVIGGSSSINAMSHYHGHPADYDRWASAGLTGWSHAHVLPYFRRMESWQGPASPWRGRDGPVATRYSRFPDPLCDAFLAAGRAAGYAVIDDYNGPAQEGFARLQSTIRDGRRCGAAAAYLRPALRRANLAVKVRATAARVLFDGRRATGVEYLVAGRPARVHARCEVILCSGAINSPQLLMLSGIGDPAQLRRHGIEVRAPLAGVGRNLRDHYAAPIVFRRRSPGPFLEMLRADRAVVAMAMAYLRGTGLATDLPLGVTAFLKTDPALALPDVQLHPWMGPTADARPYLGRPGPDSVSCRVMPLRPRSAGRVELASADPLAPVRIHQDFLGSESEWRTMLAGFRLMRYVLGQDPLRGELMAELAPGPDCVSDADIMAHVRAAGGTVHHPIGTCRMGADGDEGAVLDPELRVRGVENLRVIDASAMPDLTGATNARVTMIAEKASDLVRGRPPLPPDRTADAVARAAKLLDGAQTVGSVRHLR